MRDRFYLQCTRDTVGTRAAFHGKDKRGYVTDLDKAHVYTREEAQRAYDRGREIDRPISADHVDALAEYRTDCQKLPYESRLGSVGQPYVAFVKGRWDGNDVYWWTGAQGCSLNFLQAKQVNTPDLSNSSLVWVPWADADAVKRRTFSVHDINPRRMITGAGLRMPAHIARILRRERRPSTGKVRMNCPDCGALIWQYNPHEAERCSSPRCERY